MVKKFNVLIIGLGSIGQRHLRNINKIFPKTTFFAYRKKFKTPSLNNLNKVVSYNLKKKFKINYLKDLKNLYKFKIHAAFICSPSRHHIKEAIEITKQKIHVFIEKPLGSSLRGVAKLKKIINKNNVNSMIGYQMRFNPMIKYLKKIINSKQNGKINQVSIHHGESIKNFHTYEDYRNLYASKKQLGGGVVLTQIHEIDYFLYLFSDYKIEKFKSFAKKNSNLEINVEDTLSSIFLLKKNKENLICNINLNCYETPTKRSIILVYENKRIEADFIKKKIIFYYKNRTKIKFFKFSRNEIFINEIKYFFSHVIKNQKIPKTLNIENGIKTLKFALELKK